MKIVRDEFRGGYRYWFYCPGCGHAHSYIVGCGIANQNWTFDISTVTFSPSLRVYTSHPQTKAEKTLCHLFLKSGRLEYLGDCDHGLKGQTIDLPDFPEGYGLPDPHEQVL